MKPYQVFINETQNTKIPIFEIDLPGSIAFWLNDSPGVYKYKYRNKAYDTQLGFQIGAFCYGNFKFNGIADTGTNAAPKRISSFIVNGSNYSRMANLTDCKRNSYSFYFDAPNSLLYVNFFDVLPWNVASIKAGITRGFATQSIYLEDVYYEPRIKSIPAVSIKSDDLFYGIRRYSSGTVSLFNNDGHFDDFVNETVFGQECRIKLGGTTEDGTVLQYVDYKTLYTGYVQQFKTTPDDLQILLGDKKDKVGRVLPINHYSATTYPNISDQNAGKPIGLAWGTCLKVPCICVNEDASPAPANYQFVIADITKHSIKTLNTVYINNVAQSAKTLVNDATNNIAYFNIASGGNYSPGNTVTADIVGYDDSTARDGSGAAIEDALDIVKDIFNDYLSISYNSSNYDTDNWTSESLTDYNQGIYIGENTRVSQILEKIAVGHLGIFFTDGEGRWVFKRLNDSAAPQMLITTDEIFNAPEKLDDGKKYLTSATVKYKKNYEANRYKDYTDDSNESSIFYTYGLYRTENFETYLSTDSEAVELAGNIATEFNTVRSEYDIVTTIRAADLQLNETINASINRMASTWIGPIKARVMGIKYELNNPVQIQLSIKHISAATEDLIFDTILAVKADEYSILVTKNASDGIRAVK